MIFILVLLSTLLSIYLFHLLYWKRRNLPPGPTPLPKFGNWLSMVFPMPGYECFRRWTKKYGDVYTFWLDLPSPSTMPARTTPDLESQVSQTSALVIPPPYMDPAHAQAKKLQSRLSRESISQMKPCEHCGAAPHAQVAHLQREQVFVWPAVRPTNHIHQDSRNFIGYLILIAFVIFLLFAACKYLP